MDTNVSLNIARLIDKYDYVHSNKSPLMDVYDMEDGQIMHNVHVETLMKGAGLWYHAPTISEVVMWIYRKYGYWIECNHCGTFNQFTFKVSRLDKKNVKKEPHYMNDFGKGFNSPKEAYEVAIEHCMIQYCTDQKP